MSKWPVLAEEALYGVAGRFVKKAAPTVEGDPAAILTHFLVAFGNLIGHGPYYELGAEQHTNLFAVITGESAFARKWTSWVPVKKFFKLVDSEWAEGCVYSGGFGSGEALIEAVRNPKTGKDGVIVDPGVDDKRVFWLDAEFGKTLKVMNREDCILSAVTRLAWDGLLLESKTRKNPIKATGAHISIVAHITAEELQQLLKPADYYNGFVNRHLWCMAKRSQKLCDPPDFDEQMFAPEVEVVRQALSIVNANQLTGIAGAFARIDRVRQSVKARDYWAKIYPPMGEDVPKNLQHTISRVAPQIRRIAVIQALLNCSKEIKLDHLKAAKAVWNYYQQSAEYLFGKFVTDKQETIAAEILRKNGKVSRDEVRRNVFKGHATPQVIDDLMTRLEQAGLGTPGQTQTGGKPAKVLFQKRT